MGAARRSGLQEPLREPSRRERSPNPKGRRVPTDHRSTGGPQRRNERGASGATARHFGLQKDHSRDEPAGRAAGMQATAEEQVHVRPTELVPQPGYESLKKK